MKKCKEWNTFILAIVWLIISEFYLFIYLFLTVKSVIKCRRNSFVLLQYIAVFLLGCVWRQRFHIRLCEHKTLPSKAQYLKALKTV